MGRRFINGREERFKTMSIRGTRYLARRRLLVVASAVVVAAIAAGLAYAAIPDAHGLIHACYSPNGSTATNGTQLNIVDADRASCSKGQQAISWNQTGPAGRDGRDGLDGAKGDKGDKGDPGVPGPSDAYANYGDGVHTIGDGLTQTVASVTVPAGSYVLSATVAAGQIDSGPEDLQCQFVAGGAVHGVVALLQANGRSAIIGDATVTNSTNPIFLRCQAEGGESEASGELIAIHVGTVTPSQ
jgi:hypothetical protein